MGILNIIAGTAGADNQAPRIVYIKTNDTVSAILTSGYLNAAVQSGYYSPIDTDMCLVSSKTSAGASTTEVGWYEVSISGSTYSLSSTAGAGDVVLPTVANQLIHATNTTGGLSSDAVAAVTHLGAIYAGASGTAGAVRSYSTTAARGFLALTGVANTGDTAVTISNAAHGQASVISIPDGGQATSEFIIADSAGTQNITSGALQIDAGAISGGLLGGGFAGSLILWANTTVSGNLALLAVDNATGDFDTVISNAAAVAQDQVITIPDSGQATSEFIIADSGATQNITSGALQVDAGAISGGLAAGGFAGSLILWATTTASGNLALLNVDNATGDFDTVISNAAAVAQDQVISIPDSGQSTSEFIIADSGATQNITSGAIQVDAGAISGGLAAGGFAGSLILWANTTASGNLALLAVDNATGDFDSVISNAAAVAQDQVLTIPDSGASTANFLLDTGAANIIAHQEFVGIPHFLIASAGTWTITRVAQGNIVLRHTAADDTSILAFDITPQIRVAASKGFRLDSFDVVYAITSLALDAHSVTLDRIEYANNVAVSVNTIAITTTLATATQANPYLTNAAVDAPAFDVTADSKYIIELTVDAGATSDYDLMGFMLRFSETIG